MKDKINIAEILKDCPSGMELDCTSYDNVSFDGISDDEKATYPIFCYITDKEGNRSGISFTENGCESKRYGAKCVIFPKGKTTWEGFHRPFKDGDILSYQFPWFKNRSVYIYRYHPTMNTSYYVALSGDLDFSISPGEGCALYGNNDTARLATEEEKEKLFQAIKEHRYKWNPETKTLDKLPKFKVGDRIVRKNSVCVPILITNVSDEFYYSNTGSSVGVLSISEQDEYVLVPDEFNITTLVPFESRVLVRNYNKDAWRVSFWGCLIDNEHGFKYDTIRGSYKQCIPYEGNEHLIGTTNDCDEYFKTWK